MRCACGAITKLRRSACKPPARVEPHGVFDYLLKTRAGSMLSRMLKKPFRRVLRDETISFFKHPALSNSSNRVFFNTLLELRRRLWQTHALHGKRGTD